MIHHPFNLVKIEGGFTGAWHNRITGRYRTKGFYTKTEGMSLRDWLVGKDIQTHYEWGLRVMKELKT